MFLSKILILLYMIIHYTMKKKYFFCIYFLEAFSTEEILKHIKNCFDINGKQRIIIPKKRRMP